MLCFLFQEGHTRDIKCVVPENIHTPAMDGVRNSERGGGSKTQEIPEGRVVA